MFEDQPAQDFRFIPGLTEETERKRRHEQRRMDLHFAFARDTDTKDLYNVIVEARPTYTGRVEILTHRRSQSTQVDSHSQTN